MSKNNSSAFTLVEIAIVLLIISIISASAYYGLTLKNNANLQSIMSEVTKIKNAVETFEITYKQLPGDMYNPDNYFTTSSVNGNPATTRGDGNGTISGNEGIYAFQHLALANIITGNYNGQWIYNRMYKGPIANSVFYFTSAYGDPLVLRFAKVTYSNPDVTVISGAALTRAALTVVDTKALDTKYDDGNPSLGMIISYTGSDATANSCVNAGNYATPTDQNSETLNCYIDFRIKRDFYSTTN
ncbi:MAG: prepilin-type N-terminal cleavage/methylation domain-containing protein [Sphingobacteriia bacterium]|nr:prepilin-type N-terminal cleavage/methylation domain-containing protein [Sphingobacteriia bacterium]